eukprot:4390260-Pleurochrysis_carterae.AAC.2
MNRPRCSAKITPKDPPPSGRAGMSTREPTPNGKSAFVRAGTGACTSLSEWASTGGGAGRGSSSLARSVAAGRRWRKTGGGSRLLVVLDRDGSRGGAADSRRAGSVCTLRRHGFRSDTTLMFGSTQTAIGKDLRSLNIRTHSNPAACACEGHAAMRESQFPMCSPK